MLRLAFSGCVFLVFASSSQAADGLYSCRPADGFTITDQNELRSIKDQFKATGTAPIIFLDAMTGVVRAPGSPAAQWQVVAVDSVTISFVDPKRGDVVRLSLAGTKPSFRAAVGKDVVVGPCEQMD